jgi:HPt (histidine-containing phosphotransfer) domain-containing protein
MSSINLDYLINITGGDNAIMAEMIELLLEETPKHLHNIQDYLENEQWTKLGAEAHKIKPMFMYVGLSDLHDAAQELEANGKNAVNLDAIPELINTIETGFQSVQDELKEMVTELSD